MFVLEGVNQNQVFNRAVEADTGTWWPKLGIFSTKGRSLGGNSRNQETKNTYLGVLHELTHKQRLVLLRGEVLQHVDLLGLDVRGVTVAAEELCIVVAEAIRRLLHQQRDVRQACERHFWVGVP